MSYVYIKMRIYTRLWLRYGVEYSGDYEADSAELRLKDTFW